MTKQVQRQLQCLWPQHPPNEPEHRRASPEQVSWVRPARSIPFKFPFLFPCYYCPILCSCVAWTDSKQWWPLTCSPWKKYAHLRFFKPHLTTTPTHLMLKLLMCPGATPLIYLVKLVDGRCYNNAVILVSTQCECVSGRVGVRHNTADTGIVLFSLYFFFSFCSTRHFHRWYFCIQDLHKKTRCVCLLLCVCF